MNTFTTEDGRVLKSALAGDGESQGSLIILRPAKLAEEGVTGTVAEGIYEGSVQNKFDETKLDYKVRAENNDLYIINSTGSLAKQMLSANPGDYVVINYDGKTEITSGKLKGKSVHRFEVFIG